MTLPTHQLIAKPEGKTLEFKRDLSSPKNLLKTLVSFANSAGGVLLVGVADGGGKVVGIRGKPLDEEERLCNLIADSIEPRLVPNVELVAFQKKTLLAVEVYPSGPRPHWLKSEGPLEGVYVRLGSTNRKADRALIEELKRSAAGTSFDEMPMPEVTGKALDIAAAKKAFKGVRAVTEKELVTLKLLTRVQGRLVPTIGGMLLFGKDRDQHFSDAWVQCGRFEGTTKSVIFDHTEIHDHLPALVERAIEFIQKHAMRGADLSQVRRRDVWSVPLSILREAVVNAIVHADYSQTGGPLRIAIYDDRVEVENPGILVPGLTLDDVRQGVSKLRNKVIGRVFRELGLIEQWGSGVRRMYDEAQKLGLPEPKIEEIGMRLRFTVYRAEPISVSSKTPQVTPQVTPHVTPQVQRVIENIRGEMTRGELMEVLELKDREHFRKDYLQPALRSGLIQMTVPDKPRSTRQKYRLTDRGRLALNAQGKKPQS